MAFDVEAFIREYMNTSNRIMNPVRNLAADVVAQAHRAVYQKHFPGTDLGTPEGKKDYANFWAGTSPFATAKTKEGKPFLTALNEEVSAMPVKRFGVNFGIFQNVKNSNIPKASYGLYVRGAMELKNAQTIGDLRKAVYNSLVPGIGYWSGKLGQVGSDVLRTVSDMTNGVLSSFATYNPNFGEHGTNFATWAFSQARGGITAGNLADEGDVGAISLNRNDWVSETIGVRNPATDPGRIRTVLPEGNNPGRLILEDLYSKTGLLFTRAGSLRDLSETQRMGWKPVTITENDAQRFQRVLSPFRPQFTATSDRMRYEANADLLRSYVGTPFHSGGDYIGTEDPLATQLERRRQIIGNLPGQFNSGGNRGSVQFTREIFDHLTVTKLDPRYGQMRADPVYGNLVRGSWAEGEKDPYLYERRTAMSMLKARMDAMMPYSTSNVDPNAAYEAEDFAGQYERPFVGEPIGNEPYHSPYAAIGRNTYRPQRQMPSPSTASRGEYLLQAYKNAARGNTNAPYQPLTVRPGGVIASRSVWGNRRTMLTGGFNSPIVSTAHQGRLSGSGRAYGNEPMYIGRSSAYRENYASEEAAYIGFVSENDSIRIINGQVAGTRLNDTRATFLNPVGAGRGIEYGAWKSLTDTRFEQFDRDIAAGKHAYIVDEEMGTFLGQLERDNPRMARYFEKQLEERGIIRANTGADDAFAYGGFYSGVQTQSGQLAAEQAQRELASSIAMRMARQKGSPVVLATAEQASITGRAAGWRDRLAQFDTESKGKPVNFWESAAGRSIAGRMTGRPNVNPNAVPRVNQAAEDEAYYAALGLSQAPIARRAIAEANQASGAGNQLLPWEGEERGFARPTQTSGFRPRQLETVATPTANVLSSTAVWSEEPAGRGRSIRGNYAYLRNPKQEEWWDEETVSNLGGASRFQKGYKTKRGAGLHEIGHQVWDRLPAKAQAAFKPILEREKQLAKDWADQKAFSPREEFAQAYAAAGLYGSDALREAGYEKYADYLEQHEADIARAEAKATLIDRTEGQTARRAVAMTGDNITEPEDAFNAAEDDRIRRHEPSMEEINAAFLDAEEGSTAAEVQAAHENAAAARGTPRTITNAQKARIKERLEAGMQTGSLRFAPTSKAEGIRTRALYQQVADEFNMGLTIGAQVFDPEGEDDTTPWRMPVSNTEALNQTRARSGQPRAQQTTDSPVLSEAAQAMGAAEAAAGATPGHISTAQQAAAGAAAHHAVYASAQQLRQAQIQNITPTQMREYLIAGAGIGTTTSQLAGVRDVTRAPNPITGEMGWSYDGKPIRGETADQAVSWARSAVTGAVKGVLPSDTHDLMGTVMARINKTISGLYDEALKAAGNDTGMKQEAARAADIAKSVAKNIVDTAGRALGEDAIDQRTVKHIAYGTPVRVASKRGAALAMEADPELAAAIAKQEGGLGALLTSRERVRILGDQGIYEFGGWGGDTYQGGDAGDGAGGPGPKRGGIWGGKMGAALYGAYIAKRIWSWTAGPEQMEAAKYGQYLSDAVLPLAQAMGAGEAGTQEAGFGARQAITERWFQRGSYQQWGGISDATYSFTGSGEALPRVMSAAKVGAGIAGMAAIAPGMAGMMGIALPGAAAIPGIGLAVGGAIVATSVGQEIWNAANPNETQQTFGNWFSSAVNAFNKMNARRAARRQIAEGAGWELGGGYANEYYATQDIDITDEVAERFMTPEQRSLAKLKREGEPAQTVLARRLGDTLQYVTGEGPTATAAASRALIRNYGQISLDQAAMWGQNFVSTGQSWGEGINAAVQLGEQLGYAPGTPGMQATIAQYGAQTGIGGAAAMLRRGSRVAQMAGQIAGFFENGLVANQLTNQYNLITAGRMAPVQALTAALSQHGINASDIWGYEARGTEETKFREITWGEALIRQAKELGPERSRYQAELSDFLMQAGVPANAAFGAVSQFGIQTQTQLRTAQTIIQAAQQYGFGYGQQAYNLAGMGAQLTPFQATTMANIATPALMAGVGGALESVISGTMGMSGQQLNVMGMIAQGDIRAASFEMNQRMSAGKQFSPMMQFFNLAGKPNYQTDFTSFLRWGEAWEKGGQFGIAGQTFNVPGNPMTQGVFSGLQPEQMNLPWQPWSTGIQPMQPGSATLPMNAAARAQQWFTQNGVNISGQDAATWAQGGALGRTLAHVQEMAGYQMASAGIQMQGALLQEQYLWGGGPWSGTPAKGSLWWYEDQQRNLQWKQQLSSFAYSKERMEVGNEFAIRQEGITGERMAASHDYQRWQMSFNYQDMLTQRGWAKEDWAYQDQMRGMQFGWQMEDINEAIRTSSGRQRAQYIKQRDRMALTENIEGEHIEDVRSRQEEQWAREDKRFEKQRSYTEELMDLEDEQFELQKEQRVTFYDLEMEQLEKQISFAKQAHKLQEEQIKVQREFQAKQIELSKQAAGIQAASAKETKDYAEQMELVTRKYEDTAGYAEQLIKNDPTVVFKAFTDMGIQFNKMGDDIPVAVANMAREITRIDVGTIDSFLAMCDAINGLSQGKMDLLRRVLAGGGDEEP